LTGRAGALLTERTLSKESVRKEQQKGAVFHRLKASARGSIVWGREERKLMERTKLENLGKGKGAGYARQ